MISRVRSGEGSSGVPANSGKSAATPTLRTGSDCSQPVSTKRSYAAARHFSYGRLRKGLDAVIGALFGDAMPPLKPASRSAPPALNVPTAACNPAACGDCQSFYRALS